MTEPCIEVRKGTASDVEQVSTLLAQTWTQTYSNVLSPADLTDIIRKFHSVESLKRQIDNTDASFFVCESDGKILGHAYAHMKPNDVLWLTKLYILPAAQGVGLGQLLFHEICNSHPIARVVQLEVGRENAGAIKFYERIGFVKIDEVDKCGGEFDIPAFVMSMDLST